MEERWINVLLSELVYRYMYCTVPLIMCVTSTVLYQYSQSVSQSVSTCTGTDIAGTIPSRDII